MVVVVVVGSGGGESGSDSDVLPRGSGPRMPGSHTAVDTAQYRWHHRWF